MESKSSLTKLAQTAHLDLPTMLHHLRVRSKLSARELSVKAGLSASYVSKVESGILHPTVDAFAKLIEHLDCTDYELAFLIRSLSK